MRKIFKYEKNHIIKITVMSVRILGTHLTF